MNSPVREPKEFSHHVSNGNDKSPKSFKETLNDIESEIFEFDNQSRYQNVYYNNDGSLNMTPSAFKVYYKI